MFNCFAILDAILSNPRASNYAIDIRRVIIII